MPETEPEAVVNASATSPVPPAMPLVRPSSSTVPVAAVPRAVGVSSSTRMATFSAEAVTVSPSLSVACTTVPRLMVMSFSLLPAAWSSGLSRVKV